MKNLKNLEQTKYWDSHWTGLDNTILQKNIFYIIDMIKLRYLLKKLPKNAKTLEVGGGSSRISCFLAKKGYETVILDYSKKSFAVAKNNYKIMNVKGKFVYGNALDMPFKNNSFDFVFSTGLLEHFEEPHIVINEMSRVLKKGGLFFSDVIPKKFSLFRSLDFLPELYVKLTKGKIDDMYERNIKKAELKQMMKDAELKEINVYGICILPPRALLLSHLPILRKSKKIQKINFKVMNKLARLLAKLDGTRLADIIGFGYNCFGTKK